MPARIFPPFAARSAPHWPGTYSGIGDATFVRQQSTLLRSRVPCQAVRYAQPVLRELMIHDATSSIRKRYTHIATNTHAAISEWELCCDLAAKHQNVATSYRSDKVVSTFLVGHVTLDTSLRQCPPRSPTHTEMYFLPRGYLRKGVQRGRAWPTVTSC
jgi:hypothetical protein